MAIVLGNMTFTGGFQFTNSGSTPPGPTPLSDQYFQYNTLLLDGLGTNGAQNNTFLDSSTNNFTITRNGNTTQGSFTPFSHSNGYWSNYFDGSGDSLSISGTNQALSNIFTIEMWVYPLVSPNGTYYYIGGSTTGPLIGYNGTTFSVARQGSWVLTSSTNPIVNAWNHIAVVREGTGANQYKLYVNGTLTATGTESTTFGAQTGASIGGVNAYISNFRIVNGTAVYTSNFTPSTAPLTAITNTSLLTCQSNRFIDNSTSNITLTRNGDTTVTLFQPFTLSTEYNSSTMSGSIYFDGTGDYLTAPSNSAFAFGTGDFTIECWVYFRDFITNDGVFQLGSSYFPGGGGLAVAAFGAQGWQLYYGGISAAAGTTPSINTWYHLALVRSGTSLKLYVNGVLNTSVTDNTNYTGTFLAIGGYFSTDYLMTGYISNFRIVKGTAVYTSAFTPPTSPVTAISGTSLLLNGTNAGVVDSTGFNDLETVGNAQISTAQSKWGGSSLYFDGSGDFLRKAFTSTSDGMYLQGTTYTVEAWIYMNSISGKQIVYSVSADLVGNFGDSAISINGGTLTYEIRPITGGSVTTITAGAVSVGVWTHIALSVNSGTARLFVNGVAGSSGNVPAASFIPVGSGIGRLANGYTSGLTDFNGYIQGLRVTNGIARYTTTFTPPTDY